MAVNKDAAHLITAASSAAGVSSTKLLLALLAISLGTVIECEHQQQQLCARPCVRATTHTDAPGTRAHAIAGYDYSCYSQLSKVLGKVFFPPGNAAVQAVSFWGLFAGASISDRAQDSSLSAHAAANARNSLVPAPHTCSRLHLAPCWRRHVWPPG